MGDTARGDGHEMLPGRLRLAVNRLHHHIRIHAVADDVTPSRLAVLGLLATAGGPLRIGELAQRAAMSFSTMSRLLDSLDEAEFIVRRPDPGDSRASLISLSAHGIEVFNQARRQGTEHLQHSIAGLTSEQVQTLVAALPALEALADHAACTREPAGQRTASVGR